MKLNYGNKIRIFDRRVIFVNRLRAVGFNEKILRKKIPYINSVIKAKLQIKLFEKIFSSVAEYTGIDINTLGTDLPTATAYEYWVNS